MVVELRSDPSLAPGRVRAPAGVGRGRRRLRLGCCVVEAELLAGDEAPVLWLAADLWEQLGVPYEAIRLQVVARGAQETELGPSLAVLYSGTGANRTPEQMTEVGRLYFGHLRGLPGLLGFAFDERIDWQAGHLHGWVLDNRPGREGQVMTARFAIPGVVRLAWSILDDVITRLRELTGNRTFNWIRNIGKWQFYSTLSAVDDLMPHLPETRIYRGPVDLMIMLSRYETVFLKQTLGIRGRQSLRIRKLPNGLQVHHMDGRRLVIQQFRTVDELEPYARSVLGKKRAVIQQGIRIAGQEGRAMDCRIVMTRGLEPGWRMALAMANVAPDEQLVFTNVANGASDEAVHPALMRHHGMSEAEAHRCVDRMVDLCQRASAVLAQRYDPLGILGFDVAVEAGSHHLWLLEANSVPGWGYPLEVEQRLARSQAEFGLSLTGFSITVDRRP